MTIRSYKPGDYERVIALYKQSNLFGGQFDENRDSKERLQKRIEADSDALLVAEENDEIVGTVSLIEDGRVAWLFRFCVINNEDEEMIAKHLADKAEAILASRGHNQVLVYTALNNEELHTRYKNLGFTNGGEYTCFWKDI